MFKAMALVVFDAYIDKMSLENMKSEIKQNLERMTPKVHSFDK